MKTDIQALNHSRCWAALLRGLFFGGVLAGVFLLAELAFSYLANGYRPQWNRWELVVLLVSSLSIVMGSNRRLARAGLVFMGFLQLSSMAYFAYCGAFYGPSHVILLFLDFGEVVESILGAPGQILPALALVAAVFWVVFRVLRESDRRMVYHSHFFSVLMVLLCLAPVIHAFFEDNSQKHEPDTESLALKNGLYSVSFFIGNDLPGRLSGRYTSASYVPYSDRLMVPKPAYHVVFILGESTAFSHLQLYGYDKETTPQLVELARGGDFVWRYGIASGVSTRVAVPMLLNTQREPDNLRHIASKKGALFHLAKQNGFQTAFLSSGDMSGISSSLSSPDIDIWQDIKQLKALAGDRDRRLLTAIDKADLDWQKPVYLVLNPRCCHSPYDYQVPPEERKFSVGIPHTSSQYRVASYDDAMLYLDRLMTDLMKSVQERSKLPVVFVMTSDHGQKLGEDGQFGHNFLDLTTARVPFFVYAPQGLPEAARQLPCVMPHYEIARFLAGLLGYQIDNPNAEGDHYFVNGVDISGRGGHLAYSRAAVERELKCGDNQSQVPGASQALIFPRAS